MTNMEQPRPHEGNGAPLTAPQAYPGTPLTLTELHEIIRILGEQLETAHDNGVTVGRALQLTEDRQAWAEREAELGRWRHYARHDNLPEFRAELTAQRDADVRAAVTCLTEHGNGDPHQAITGCRCHGSRILHQTLTTRSDNPWAVAA
jgi:hypothetical protein